MSFDVQLACAFRKNSGLMVSDVCPKQDCVMKLVVFVGDYDCMDWSDEIFFETGKSCSVAPDSFACDEHLCSPDMYSCGDGQCILWSSRMAFQRFFPISDDCFSKRNLNYMCEASPHRSTWTLQSGLCWPDRGYDDPRYLAWNMSNSSQLTDADKYQYLFRCALSDGFERDCPCNRQNCTVLMMNINPSGSRYVIYPPKGLINGNVFFSHDFRQSMEILNAEPHVFLYGNMKCRGYQLTTKITLRISFHSDVLLNSRFNHELCTGRLPVVARRDTSSPFQYDKFCWTEYLTFNGQPYAVKPDTCPYGQECISQYRIHDGFYDCLKNEDEEMNFENSYCTGNVGQQRFQCFSDEHQCLSLHLIGSGISHCLNHYDERWYGLEHSFLQSARCIRSDTTDCKRWKEYIQQSSTKTLSNDSSLATSEQDISSNQISFRSHCDSFWDLKEHIDELASSCQYWICQNHQYQCQTGQCIEIDWVCDGEWDCADASDEEAIAFIKVWSIHNARLLDLKDRINKCHERYSQSPFSKICNTSFEFGCYQVQGSNPLEIRLNRPCINLTQIGDGVENCYNSYDEKNTFAVKSNKMGMWGFHFRCENYTTEYPFACHTITRNNCTKILCPNHQDKVEECSGARDVICLEDDRCIKNARCDGKPDCLHGDDEYWCAPGSITQQMFYRTAKKISWPITMNYITSIQCFHLRL